MNKILLAFSIILLASGNANAVDLPNTELQDQTMQSITDSTKSDMTLEEKLAAKKAAVRAKMEAKKTELGTIRAENVDVVEISETEINTPDTQIVSEEVIENPEENIADSINAAIEENVEVINETQNQAEEVIQNIENDAMDTANAVIEESAETVEEIQNQAADEINQNPNNPEENAEQAETILDNMEDVL